MVLFEHSNECACSYTIYLVMVVIIILTISIGIGPYFVYFCWYSKRHVTRVKFGTRTQTIIY